MEWYKDAADARLYLQQCEAEWSESLAFVCVRCKTTLVHF